MHRHYTWRHAALPLLALVTALTVSRQASWGQTKQAAIPSTLEGTWNVTVTPDPRMGPPFPALVTFTSNGGLVVSDKLGPGVGQGAWAQSGDHTFNYTILKLSFDSKGQFVGTLKVRQAITVNETFDALSGPSKVDFFDPAGKRTFSGPESIQGTRMRVEAIP